MTIESTNEIEIPLKLRMDILFLSIVATINRTLCFEKFSNLLCEAVQSDCFQIANPRVGIISIGIIINPRSYQPTYLLS